MVIVVWWWVDIVNFGFMGSLLYGWIVDNLFLCVECFVVFVVYESDGLEEVFCCESVLLVID